MKYMIIMLILASIFSTIRVKKNVTDKSIVMVTNLMQQVIDSLEVGYQASPLLAPPVAMKYRGQ